jgi:ribosomal protein S18 acetylase RimI-like enzyme
VDLKIRKASYSDFDEIFILLKQLWQDSILNKTELRKVFHEAVNSDRQHLIAGLSDKKIVGFCSLTVKNNLWQAGNLGHIDELIVDKNFRGRGYGKQLMNKIIEVAIENKCKRIELDSAFHRKEAHTFYESIGFKNRAYLFSKTV